MSAGDYFVAVSFTSVLMHVVTHVFPHSVIPYVLREQVEDRLLLCAQYIIKGLGVRSGLAEAVGIRTHHGGQLFYFFWCRHIFVVSAKCAFHFFSGLSVRSCLSSQG